MGLRRGSDVLAAALLLSSALALLASASTARAQDELERKSLERKLNESVASQSVNYTTVNVTGIPYKASTKFNPKGMGQLYNVTNMFIDLIQPKQAYPDGMIKLVNGQLVLANPATEWRMILKHYGGLAGLGLSGLLLAALLPCVGLFFCCCRCAGRCGARSEPFDKKHDHCRKVVLSIFLICFATILCFGVVCAFVTNEQMQEGTRELPQAAKVSLGDVKLYLNTTRYQIDTLLKLNYKELEHTLGNILHESGRIVTEQLTKDSHADSLMNLMSIVSGLENIKQDLETMNNSSKKLRAYADDLNNCMRGVKRRLQETFKRCGTQACSDFVHKNKVNEMELQVHFDRYMDRYFPKLPDDAVTQALDDISALMAKDIVHDVRLGIEQFMKIQNEIQQAVNETIPQVNSSIKKAGDSIENQANSIDQMIGRIIQQIDKTFIPKLNSAKGHIDKFSPYRYYLGLAISGVLLTVLTCITFGLLCGICGKRPDGYGDDCCNKGSGARFLMMAVWIIFLLTSILMIITVAHMITGVLAERAICEPLKNSSDNRMFKLVDDFLNIKGKIYPNIPEADINMSHILSSCHKNETLYNVLKLQYIIDIDTLKGYVDSYDINQTIHELEERITISPDYEIISTDAKQKLNDLASSGLSTIQFDKYTEELKENITTVDLGQLAKKLREFVNTLPNSLQDIKDKLLKNAEDLDKCQTDIFNPMVNVSNHLSISAMELQEHIKFNHSSMPEAIHKLISETDEAQEFLTKKGPAHVKMLASELGKAFIQQVDKYLSHVINKILTEVGKCGPMSNAYNATLVAGCNKILDPFNGFWASVGWCLILFIPTIVLCVKLSALYQKSDPYPGPLVEAEYLYDAYADRDNVPLAHIHDKKYVGRSRHNPGGGYPESYDGPALGYSDRERISDAHQSTSHHEARFTNSNPQEQSNVSKRVFPLNQNIPQKIFTISNGSKNWEFPNGGPPRYQPAAVAPPLSTEYERPPPYYYPGPGDRN